MCGLSAMTDGPNLYLMWLASASSKAPATWLVRTDFLLLDDRLKALNQLIWPDLHGRVIKSLIIWLISYDLAPTLDLFY